MSPVPAAKPALVALADGPDGPLPAPAAVGELAGLAPGSFELLTGWVVRQPVWLDGDEIDGPGVTTILAGPGLRRAVERGKITPLAVRLSSVPNLLASRMRPAVAVVGAYEDPSTRRWRVAASPGWALAAARSADAVVVERWPGPPPAGRPVLPDCRIANVYDRDEPPDARPSDRRGDDHRAIAGLVAGIVPDRATIQWGPGVIGGAVVAALERPVRVRSGLVTEELAGLAERGLLIGEAEAAYVWGGPRLRDMEDAGRLRLREVGYTHDITALSSIPRFVAVNTALQVGLDGSVNVERVRGRVVAGPGGHPDFAAGASRSPGGMSVVALVSTAGGGSTIVARPEVVSTPRSDVDVVVTEHGVADLRGCPDEERARRLLSVAHPAHRADLEAALGAALEAGL